MVWYPLNYTPLNMDEASLKIFQYGLKKAGAIRQVNEERGLIYYSISTEPEQSGCPLIFGGSFIGTHSGGDEERKLNGGNLFD
jgi:hypothetical protein